MHVTYQIHHILKFSCCSIGLSSKLPFGACLPDFIYVVLFFSFFTTEMIANKIYLKALIRIQKLIVIIFELHLIFEFIMVNSSLSNSWTYMNAFDIWYWWGDGKEKIMIFPFCLLVNRLEMMISLKIRKSNVLKSLIDQSIPNTLYRYKIQFEINFLWLYSFA